MVLCDTEACHYGVIWWKGGSMTLHYRDLTCGTAYADMLWSQLIGVDYVKHFTEWDHGRGVLAIQMVQYDTNA